MAAGIVENAIAAAKSGAVKFDVLAGYKPSQEKLDQRRILITGGASGIGAALCKEFAQGSAWVVIADRDEALGRELEKELTSAGLKARFIKVDVSSWNSQVQLFQQAIEYFPGAELDVLIPCAGIRGYVNLDMPSAPPGLKPLQALQIAASSPPSTACIDVGLIGTTYSVELSIKYGMGLVGAEATQIDKSIILVGSMAGFRFVPGSVDYTAVKWGIRGMFKCMRARLPSLGVRVNLLAPTYIATPLTAKIVPALQSKGVKLGRIVDVVHCVSRIVEDSSIDGRALCVSGNGIVDLGDDIGGCEGAEAMLEMYKTGAMDLSISWK